MTTPATHQEPGQRPAFPRQAYREMIQDTERIKSWIDHEDEPGLTIRDWFAGRALDRVIEMVAMDRAKHPSITNEEWRAQFAIEAYAIADAMLAARAQPPGGRDL